MGKGRHHVNIAHGRAARGPAVLKGQDGFLVSLQKILPAGVQEFPAELISGIEPVDGAERIRPLLTEQEAAVFRRGRNAHPHTVPAHASRAQYGSATALETLFGWLYLTGQRTRANELFRVIMEEEA